MTNKFSQVKSSDDDSDGRNILQYWQTILKDKYLFTLLKTTSG